MGAGDNQAFLVTSGGEDVTIGEDYSVSVQSGGFVGAVRAATTA
jgi:hypothetical protein